MTRRALLLALALGGCAAAGPLASEPVRVMAFNVRLDVASDGADAWPHRVEAVAATIREADVVGLQEATAAMLDTLDARLPGFARLGVGRDADGGGEQSPVLFRADRFEALDHRTLWLSPTPDVPGSVGWDAALPRIATVVRLRERATGRELTVINTHFDHVGAEARLNSARLLASEAQRLSGPLVLLGDLNAPPEAAPIRALAAELQDARTASETPAEGPAGTWNGFGRDPDGPRIDYVFVSDDVRVLRTATLARTVGDVLGTASDRMVSDHHAVTATLLF